MHKLITLMTMLAVAAGAWAEEETTDTSTSETTSKWYVVGGTEEDSVGSSDLSTAWWGDMSSAYYLTKDSTVTLTFKNYNDKSTSVFHNFCVVVTTNEAESDRNISDNNYHEYVVLRADAYGWGEKFNTANLFTSGFDASSFMEDMDSAEVTVKLAYSTNDTLTVTTISKTLDGNSLIQQYACYANDTISPDTLRAFLTVENAYLNSISSTKTQGVDTEMGLEKKDYVWDGFDNGYERTMVGTINPDSYAGWWGYFSSYYDIPDNNTLTLNFDNFTNEEEPYYNYVLVLTNDGYNERNQLTGYVEYLVLKANSDNYGAGTNFDLFSDRVDSTTICEEMNGASVTMKIAYYEDSVATVTTISKTTEGKYIVQQMTLNVPDSIQNLRAFLTVQGGYLDCLTSSLSEGKDVETGLYSDDYIIGGVSNSEKTKVGFEDYSATWWSQFSSYYNVPIGYTLDLDFDSYHHPDSSYTYYTYVIVATNNKSRDDTGYGEHAVLRGDNGFWGAVLNKEGTSLTTNGFNWNNFLSDSQGADVDVEIVNWGDSAAIYTTMTPTDGDPVMTQELIFNYKKDTLSVNNDTLRIFLTTERGYLENIESRLTPNGIEPYVEVSYSNGKYTTNSNNVEAVDSMTIVFGGNDDVFSYSLEDITTSNYEYLVIVPRCPYLGDNDNVNDPEKTYKLTDSSNNTVSTTLAYYGTSRRSVVYNLLDGYVYQSSDVFAEIDRRTATKSVDFSDYRKNNWTSLQISATAADTFAISAIYLTNTKPYYNNVWNFAGYEGDYQRTCTEAGTYGTICLPYASAVCGAYVYDVVGYGTDANSNPSELYLEEVNGLLEAGKAYVYKSIYDDLHGWGIYDGYVTFLRAEDDSAEEATEGNGLVGNLSSTEIAVDEDDYILFVDSVATTEGGTDSTAVYKWGKGTGNTVGQYRAYLDLSVFPESTDTVTANAKGWIRMSLASDGDDDATGIREIVSEEESVIEDDAIYNLSGVRVANPQKGIYIKNGKKYIIK